MIIGQGNKKHVIEEIMIEKNINLLNFNNS